RGVMALYEDRTGKVWVGTQTGLWQWKPSPEEFYSVPGLPDGIQGLVEADDGTLLMSMRGGVGRLVDRKPELVYPLPSPLQQFEPLSLLRDREGGLWIATSNGGVVHIHRGRTDAFASSDGLSGDDVLSFFEDREGSIWVATPEGLDRFREFTVSTFSRKQGLSGDKVLSVLTVPDGSTWLATVEGLGRWKDGRVTKEGPHQAATALLLDSRARIWSSSLTGVGYLENQQFTAVAGMPGGIVRGMVETSPDDLWIANIDGGLFHAPHGTVAQRIPW